MTQLFKPDTWIGWRKLIAFLASLAVVLWLGLAGRIDSAGLTVVVPAVVAAFMAGNAVTHFAKESKNEPPRTV